MALSVSELHLFDKAPNPQLILLCVIHTIQAHGEVLFLGISPLPHQSIYLPLFHIPRILRENAAENGHPIHGDDYSKKPAYYWHLNVPIFTAFYFHLRRIILEIILTNQCIMESTQNPLVYFC